MLIMLFGIDKYSGENLPSLFPLLEVETRGGGQLLLRKCYKNKEENGTEFTDSHEVCGSAQVLRPVRMN
jgi:hypothetical protein